MPNLVLVLHHYVQRTLTSNERLTGEGREKLMIVSYLNEIMFAKFLSQIWRHDSELIRKEGTLLLLVDRKANLQLSSLTRNFIISSIT